jgi:subtilisin family serine protease
MRHRRAVLAAVVTAVVLASGLVVTASPPAATSPVIVTFYRDAPFQNFRAAYHADDRAAANPAAWGYLNHDVVGAVQTLETQHGFRADHVYSAALRGFSARLTGAQIAALRNDPMVAAIEPDGVMAIVQSAQKRPGGGGGHGGGGGEPAQVLPWGIDRIDADISSTLAGNGSGAVSNVHAYIIDTGIDTGQPDLNVLSFVNFAGGPSKDCNGHGTHVAGTIAAMDNAIDVVGVAPGAPLHAVKVLGCSGSGSTSGVIAGIDWVTANAIRPAVANMSLSGGASQALDDAVTASAASGVVYAIAAGNDGADACGYSPARAGTADGVITVAATDSSDVEPSWSNYGSCVDIWAPGVNIISTKAGGGTTTMSGTSMATPHVAGTAALYLSSHAAAGPASVEGQLKTDALYPGTSSKDGRAIHLVYAGKY